MKSLGRGVFLAVCMSLAALDTRADAEDGVRLRVLSYNIHHGEGIDRQLDLERIAGLINSVEPHLVALQEVDKNTQRSRNDDQPAELARLTGMRVVFGANLRFQGGEYGNAVLSRFPITQHKNHHLPSFDDGEQRGVLQTVISLPGAQEPLIFLATHLDHRAADRERLASAKAVNALVAEDRAQPALLAGDLNDIPASAALRLLEQEWTPANKDVRPTIPVTNPTRQIDFILLRPADRWKVVEVKVLDEAVASDHRPIFAILELLPAGR